MTKVYCIYRLSINKWYRNTRANIINVQRSTSKTYMILKFLSRIELVSRNIDRTLRYSSIFNNSSTYTKNFSYGPSCSSTYSNFWIKISNFVSINIIIRNFIWIQSNLKNSWFFYVSILGIFSIPLSLLVRSQHIQSLIIQLMAGAHLSTPAKYQVF